jgi:hypothetical protein
LPQGRQSALRRVASLLTDSLHDAIDHNSARHLASVMLATVDGLLIQTFIDPDGSPTSRDLAAATGHTGKPERSAPQPKT